MGQKQGFGTLKCQLTHIYKMGDYFVKYSKPVNFWSKMGQKGQKDGLKHHQKWVGFGSVNSENEYL